MSPKAKLKNQIWWNSDKKNLEGWGGGGIYPPPPHPSTLVEIGLIEVIMFSFRRLYS